MQGKNLNDQFNFATYLNEVYKLNVLYTASNRISCKHFQFKLSKALYQTFF